GGNLQVLFGTAAATNVALVSATEITATSPAGLDVGVVNVRVVSDVIDVTLANGFTYTQASSAARLMEWETFSAALDGTAPERRRAHSFHWDTVNNSFLVWGGTVSGGTKKDDMWRLDPNPFMWTEVIQTSAPAGFEKHLSVWIDDRMWVWGGYIPGDNNNTG